MVTLTALVSRFTIRLNYAIILQDAAQEGMHGYYCEDRAGYHG